MSIELKVPEIGESITEVVIGEWLKAEGDYVQRDEDVVTIESEKATVEIPAPGSGKLAKIFKQSGETANVGEIIGRLEATTEEPTKKTVARKQADADTSGEEENIARLETAWTRDQGRRDSGENSQRIERDLVKKEEPVEDAHEAQDGTGESGRGTIEPREAVEAKAIKAGDSRKEEAETRRPRIIESKRLDERSTAADETEVAISPESAPGPENVALADEAPVEQVDADRESSRGSADAHDQLRSREERVVPMSPIRRRIAERLVQAQQTSAFLSTFNEIDMSAVTAVRREYQEEFQKKYGVRLGLMSFFVKAAVSALKLVPEINAEIRDSDIVYRDFYDIGVAVGSGKGLVVPVLRDAASMSFGAIEQAIQDFAKKAETNRLKPGDLEGGTFTISNGGIYGSLLSTPIINAPQSGILGMHAIQERPVVRDGQIVVRPMMYVALTYDHRIVDGREAVLFLRRIKECVEAPVSMLLEL